MSGVSERVDRLLSVADLLDRRIGPGPASAKTRLELLEAIGLALDADRAFHVEVCRCADGDRSGVETAGWLHPASPTRERALGSDAIGHMLATIVEDDPGDPGEPGAVSCSSASTPFLASARRRIS